MRKPPPLLVWIAVLVGALLVLATMAHAAPGLKVCFKGVTSDAATVPLYVDALKVAPDLLAGGVSQPDGSECSSVSPIPASVKPGISQSYTVTAVNALGQESAPSGALTFRLPTLPTPPTLVSVGATGP